MATLSDAADNFKLFVGGLEKVVKHTIQSNADLVQDFIRQQLYSGVNGRGKPLRPTYLNDPFFNSKDAGRWFHNAEGYMKWKMEKTPPGHFMVHFMNPALREYYAKFGIL